MPMNPAAPESTAPSTKPIADTAPSETATITATNADNGDGGVLPLQIGLRAFLDGGGDFLHSGIARRRTEHLAAGHEAVDDG
jgi:hypothetical protein